jgi:hypothetical protein
MKYGLVKILIILAIPNSACLNSPLFKILDLKKNYEENNFAFVLIDDLL